MTRPKKWYLAMSEEEVTVWYKTGPIRKPNANVNLGGISQVCIPPMEQRGKLTEDEAGLCRSIYWVV